MQKVAAHYFTQVILLFAWALVGDILLGYPVPWYGLIVGIAVAMKLVRTTSILWHTNGAQAVHAVATDSIEAKPDDIPNVTNIINETNYESLDDAGKAQFQMLMDSIERAKRENTDDA